MEALTLGIVVMALVTVIMDIISAYATRRIAPDEWPDRMGGI